MRARTIKPSIFKNELLGTADPAYTLVFAALWCLADRDGRLEDRPLRIHAEAMPFRDKAVTEQSLGWLAAHGFIIRYTVDGCGYIQVTKFKDHQNPHPREKESVIPQYVSDEATPRHVQGNAKDMPSNALSSFPSPLSPLLFPLSPLPIPALQQGRTRSRPKQAVEPDEFQAIRMAYPKRGGSQPWPKALKAAQARIREGDTWTDLLDGVSRYAEFVRATGKEGTEFVLQAATFFGPDKRYREPWAIPATKADARYSANVNTARTWAEGKL